MERNGSALEQNHQRRFETPVGSRCCQVHIVIRYSALILLIWTVASVVAHLIIAIVTRSKEYTEEIERLRKDLVAAREKNGFYIDEENYRTMNFQLSQQEEEIKEKAAYIEAVQEDLARTLELFKSTEITLKQKEYELEETTVSLKNTTDHLQNTRKILQDTMQDRDEQRFVVDEYSKKEEMLSNQAQSLLTVADMSTSDVKGLHEKLDRKRSVESNNDNIVRDFRHVFQQKLGHMEELVHKFAQEETSFCQELYNNFGQRLEKRAEELSTLSEQLSSIVTSQTSQHETLSNSLHSHTQNGQKWIQDNLEMSRHFL